MKHKKYTKRNPLRIGTDCSGIEAPIQALIQLNIPHKHIWSSDIDKWCIKSIKANYNPERIYGDKDGDYKDGDIRNRNHEELPDIDLYVCGFPCQPFSQAGDCKGLEDERGNVFFSCIATIRTKKPRYFILENVKGILWNNKRNKKDKYGETWKIIWREIEKLKELGYYVDWRVMNTRHYGIPQNRERVYIVGTMEGEYEWPEKCEMAKIENYIEWDIITKKKYPIFMKQFCENLSQDSIFINSSFRHCKFINSNLYAPTVLANTVGHYINYKLHRLATVKELFLLQGFDSNLIQVVSTSQLKKQIGNSMSVNVVKGIIRKMSSINN